MLEPVLVIHEDTFFQRFRPYRHPKANNDIWGGFGLETFGEDLAIVNSHDRRFLWTAVEIIGFEREIIVPGYHYVNRSFYLVTRFSHWYANLDVDLPFYPTLLDLDSNSIAGQVGEVNRLVQLERHRKIRKSEL